MRKTECPKCKQLMDKATAEAYGKVTEDDYIQMINRGNISLTLSYDYKIYTDSKGQFVVSYDSHCWTCGYKFSYDYMESTL